MKRDIALAVAIEIVSLVLALLVPLVAQAGWKVHRRDFDAHAERGPLWAIPFVSIRLARNS